MEIFKYTKKVIVHETLIAPSSSFKDHKKFTYLFSSFWGEEMVPDYFSKARTLLLLKMWNN